ncbi:MAG: alpha/beta hydrolase [Candidatus Hydrogenedentes bacterium]|nr:alpha/beta hydrolase [Candidatus Hydrogenedentota bacterium]
MPCRITLRGRFVPLLLVTALCLMPSLACAPAGPSSTTAPASAARSASAAPSAPVAAAPVSVAVPAPPGFKTDAEVQAAIFGGKVKLVDRNPPLGDSVELMSDLDCGKGGEHPLRADIYMPRNMKKPVPALIFIHGGGWKSGGKTDYGVYLVSYAKKGYVTVGISYRFSNEAPFPAALEDVKCAVRWLRANAATYHVNPDQIGVIGGSAGGYLVLMLGYTSDVTEFEGGGGNAGVSSKVQAVVDFYGPADLTTPFAQQAGVVKDFLKKPYDEAKELWAKASPITYVKPGLPPTLVLHGSIDTTVPIEQSEDLVARLKETGNIVEYDRVEGWPHTMDLAQDVNNHAQYMMDQFLAKHLPIK